MLSQDYHRWIDLLTNNCYRYVNIQQHSEINYKQTPININIFTYQTKQDNWDYESKQGNFIKKCSPQLIQISWFLPLAQVAQNQIDVPSKLKLASKNLQWTRKWQDLRKFHNQTYVLMGYHNQTFFIRRLSSCKIKQKKTNLYFIEMHWKLNRLELKLKIIQVRGCVPSHQ